MSRFDQNRPVPAERVSATETPWAVICPRHGQVFLTEAEYERQMLNPDNLWECAQPDCPARAEFDDDNWEKHLPPDPE